MPHPVVARGRRGRAGRMTAWYSTSSRVIVMKASSRDACCGVNSCSTSPKFRAISPICAARQAGDRQHVGLGAGDRDVRAGQHRRAAGRRPGTRTRTTSDEAPRISSATETSAISRPRPTTMTCSAVSAISLIRWLETKTVRPSAASPLSRSRTQRMPSGSSPLTGSSRISGRAGRRAARRRCPAAVPCRGRSRRPACAPRRVRPTSVDAPRRPGCADAVGGGERAQVVVGGPRGVHGPGLEQRTDLVQRRGLVARRAAVDGDAPGGGPVQAEDHPHRRGLAGAVGSEEPGHDPGTHREGQLVDGDLVAVRLASVRVPRSQVPPPHALVSRCRRHLLIGLGDPGVRRSSAFAAGKLRLGRRAASADGLRSELLRCFSYDLGRAGQRLRQP